MGPTTARVSILLALIPGLLGLVGLASDLVAAQQPVLAGNEIPAEIAEWAVEFLNDPATIRLRGAAEVPSKQIIVGDVAVLDGDLTVGGEIDGDVLVVHGNLRFQEGGRIGGEVTVLGGEALGSSLASIGGGLVVYDGWLRYMIEDGEVSLDHDRQNHRAERLDRQLGRAAFTIDGAPKYNRVEGLPLSFGPVIETAGPNSLRLEALGIWRTETDLADELGYELRLQQFLGGRRDFSVGASAFSQVNPIESWRLTDPENSLTTLLFHRDYRDYYERTGWLAFVTARVPGTPLHLRVEYLDEEHRYAPVRGPWSLSENGEQWRPQSLVGDGRFQSVESTLTLDTWTAARAPSGGWWLQARLRHGVGGEFDTSQSTARMSANDLNIGFLDLRRYARVGQASELSLRALVGGSLSKAALPSQFQHSLGGEGSLPGHRFFAGDCGARSRPVDLIITDGAMERTVPAFTNYGCDCIALFQAEYRGHFGVRWETGEEDRDRVGNEDDDGSGSEGSAWKSRRGVSPRWVAFFDAGRGWAYEVAGEPDLSRPGTRTLMDLGFGLLLGEGLGIYVAFPLNDENSDRGANFFIRLSRRF